MLSGSVTESLGYYTYSYSLTAVTNVTDFAILVSRGEFDSSIRPLKSTSPTGWDIVTTTGGISNMNGTFFEWGTLAGNSGLPPGGTLGGFSFTLNIPPEAGSRNNYFVFGGQPGAIVEVGRTVGPNVPEPGLLRLYCAATGLISWWIVKRARSEVASPASKAGTT